MMSSSLTPVVGLIVFGAIRNSQSPLKKLFVGVEEKLVYFNRTIQAFQACYIVRTGINMRSPRGVGAFVSFDDRQDGSPALVIMERFEDLLRLVLGSAGFHCLNVGGVN